MIYKDLRDEIEMMTDDYSLWYHGQDIFIMPLYRENSALYLLSYKDSKKYYHTVDEMFNDPVIDGKSIHDIVGELTWEP